jgi:hypothetical protein
MVRADGTERKVVSVCERFGEELERHAGWAVGLLLFAIFVIALGESSAKPFWYDELITLGSASFPGWRDLWNFYSTGLDTGSPLPALIVRVALKLPFGPEISSRLPFTLAFLVMCFCMYAFVRRRYPASYALGTLVFALILNVFASSIEARSYALMLAGTGFAMLCWQLACDGRHRPWSALGLWFSLALAIDAHSFAIFLFVPFALAQFVRDYGRRKPDWPVWAALVLFPLGLLPVLKGELLANKIYGPTFWCKPQLRFIITSYYEMSIAGWLLIAILLFFAVAAVMLQTRRPLWSAKPASCGFSGSEWVLVTVLALLPLYTLALSTLIHVYRPLYVVAFNIGIIIVFIGAVAEVAQRDRRAGIVLLVLLLVAAMSHSARPLAKGARVLAHPERVHVQFQADLDNQPGVKLLRNSSLPVVSGDPLLYAQLAYYAPPELRSRLYYLTDIADLDRYPRSATDQLNYVHFGKRLGYQILDAADFLPGNPHFLLAMGGDPAIWLPPYLLGQAEAGNVSLQLLGPDYWGSNVYDVRFSKLPHLRGAANNSGEGAPGAD